MRPVFGAYGPGVLAALQARRAPLREAAAALPVPMFAALDLHQAMADGHPEDAAAAAAMGFQVGLTVAESAEVVGFTALYTTAARLNAATAALEPVFAEQQRAEQR